MGLGKKQIEQLTSFTTTFLTFGLSGFLTMLYITDWKAIVTYIPYYNTKFDCKDIKKE